MGREATESEEKFGKIREKYIVCPQPRRLGDKEINLPTPFWKTVGSLYSYTFDYYFFLTSEKIL